MKKFASITALACAIIMLAGCSAKTNADATPEGEAEQLNAKSVETMHITKSEIENNYVYTGKVAPRESIDVMAKISGTVDVVNFDIGDKVNANDVLFKIDTTDIALNVNTARASVKTAEAGIKAAEAGVQSAETGVQLANGSSYQTNLMNAKKTLDAAEIAYNDAKTAYEDSKVMYESGIIPKSDFDKAETGYKNAELNYNTAKQSHDITANVVPDESLQRANDTLNSAKAQLETSKTQLESARAQLATAQRNLENCIIKTPISGVVASRNVEEGALVGQSAPAFTIIDLSTVKIKVDVSEQVVNTINIGDTADVYIAAVSQEPFKSTVKTVSPSANQSGTYSVELELGNEQDLLKSGMVSEVHFTREKSTDTIVVPRSAIITKNNETYVYIVENGAAKQIMVETGVDNGDKIELLSGLSEGMELVIKGQTYLTDGEAVEVISAEKED